VQARRVRVEAGEERIVEPSGVGFGEREDRVALDVESSSSRVIAPL
jgi:hypothetical protein